MLSILYNLVGPHHVSLYDVPPTAFVVRPGKKNRQVRPLIAANPNRLRFTGIQLAHAIVKADCYHRDRFEWFMAWCFLIQHHRVFDWNSTELRLNPEARHLYFDFVQTTLTGRVGNGLTLLLANLLGFPFQAHFTTHLTNNPPLGGIVQPTQAPDFICGTVATRAIFESKGSFPGVGNKGDVSGDLNDGRTQIGAWPTILGIPKSYACASYVRETGDTTEGSMVCFVDPDGENDRPEIQFTTLELLRENYAAWFVAMGLPDVARRLRSQDGSDAVSHSFVVLPYDANPAERIRIAFPSDPIFEHEIRNVLGNLFAMPRFGIELEVLKAISNLAKGEIDSLFSDELLPQSASQSDTEGGSYSLFPDGTYLGAIPRSSHEKAEVIEVIL